MKKNVKHTFVWKATRAFGMDFLRLATLDDEVSVSVRMVSSHPTILEFAAALRRLLVELQRS